MNPVFSSRCNGDVMADEYSGTKYGVEMGISHNSGLFGSHMYPMRVSIHEVVS